MGAGVVIGVTNIFFFLAFLQFFFTFRRRFFFFLAVILSVLFMFSKSEGRTRNFFFF